jgi:hypothetical protein
LIICFFIRTKNCGTGEDTPISVKLKWGEIFEARQGLADGKLNYPVID